jgi:N-acetylglucosamine malate deacetylase 1
MNILCYAAHPDDVELGMGASIRKFKREGHNIYVVVTFIPSDCKTRTNECNDSFKILDVDKSWILGLNSEKTNSRDLIQTYDTIYDEVCPNQVFTHFMDDTHQEHQVVANAAISACRKNTCSLFLWENTIPGGINIKKFNPEMWIRLSEDDINRKIKSFNCHQSQVKKYNNIDGHILNRSKFWGKFCESEYAEVFQVVKMII